MKRLPLVASFLLFIALCASAAYWAMQLFKPPVRPVAEPPRVATAEVSTEAATALFGGKSGQVAVASNYQLKGVIFSGSARDSVAILSADGKPAQAVRANMEVTPGVTIKEVHRDYVLLSEGGATKRVDLPESAKGQNGLAMTTPGPSAALQAPSQPVPGRSSQVMPPAPPATTAPPTMVVSPPPSAQPGTSGGAAAPPPSQVVTPTPVPAAPAPAVAPQVFATPPSAAGGVSTPTTPAPGPNVPPRALPGATPQPYTPPPAGQIPPGTPGPSAPLQSR